MEEFCDVCEQKKEKLVQKVIVSEMLAIRSILG